MGNWGELLLEGETGQGESFTDGLLDIIGIVMMVVGAVFAVWLFYLFFLMSTASDENKRRTAKARVFKTVSGLLIIIVLYSLLDIIKINIGPIDYGEGGKPVVDIPDVPTDPDEDDGTLRLKDYNLRVNNGNRAFAWFTNKCEYYGELDIAVYDNRDPKQTPITIQLIDVTSSPRDMGLTGWLLGDNFERFSPGSDNGGVPYSQMGNKVAYAATTDDRFDGKHPELGTILHIMVFVPYTDPLTNKFNPNYPATFALNLVKGTGWPEEK